MKTIYLSLFIILIAVCFVHTKPCRKNCQGKANPERCIKRCQCEEECEGKATFRKCLKDCMKGKVESLRNVKLFQSHILDASMWLYFKQLL